MTRPHLLSPQARHVMLDVETMGRGWDVAICSIAAVEFTAEGLGEERSVGVDWQEGDPDGRIDPKTVAWWLRQSEGARRSLLEERRGVGAFVAAEKISEWIGYAVDGNAPHYLWSKGGMDVDALVGLMRRHGVAFDDGEPADSRHGEVNRSAPWHYSGRVDLRAFLHLRPDLLEMHRASFELAHTAHGDARYQARQAVKFLQTTPGVEVA